MSTSNPELDLAEAFVEQTNRMVFLTGKAGTGKTTFLHHIRKRTHKRLIVTAPTGVAAINAGGVTLHSFFQLPFGPFLPGNEAHDGRHRFSRDKKNIIKSLDLLVVDEISIVRADLLDGVDSILRRYRRSDLPFGGVQLLMIGDLHQLAPVVKEAEWQLLRHQYESPYFFSSAALRRSDLITIELKQVYRQSDQEFIALLNRVRDGRLDPSSLETLNRRHSPGFVPPEDEGYITLCTHNSSADRINQGRLDALAGPSRWFDAEIDGNFPEYSYPTAASLELKSGAQVMFIRNDPSPDKRYFNGKIGVVSGMGEETIRVECPGEAAPIEVGRTVWEHIEYGVDPATAEITRKVSGGFSQFPLKTAWAITIHKSQGLTFDRAVIDAEAAFAHGQVYVALSRCRTLGGLVLSTPLGLPRIATDRALVDFVARTENNQPTAAQLTASRIGYQQELLLQCFDFQPLRRLLARLAGLIRAHAASGLLQVRGLGDIAVIERQSEAEICSIGDSFCRQLQGLFSDGRELAADPVIRERLAKASGYFGEKLTTHLDSWLAEAEVTCDNKEIRKKVGDALAWLREETAVKMAAVQSCGDGFSPDRYLRALSAAVIKPATAAKNRKTAPTYGADDIGHPELFERLRQWRERQATAAGVPHYQILHQKTLIQVAIHLPDTLDKLQAIKGIGAKRAEKYGEELVRLVGDYRREQAIEEVVLPETAAEEDRDRRKRRAPDKGSTRDLTLHLFRQGMTIAEIAAERDLNRQTIEGHLAVFVRDGRLAIGEVLADETLAAIAATVRAMPNSSLKELKSALGDNYSYGEVTLALAHLRRDRQE